MRTPALLLLSVLSSGCNTMARWDAPSLKGTPDSSGVVVVEADITVIGAVFGLRSDAKPVGGQLACVGGGPGTIPGDGSMGYVIFPDLEPGIYQLVKIDADWMAPNGQVLPKWYRVSPDEAAAFTFEVRAGEPVYIGAEIEEDLRSLKSVVRYHRRDEPGAEQKAWKCMGDLYAKTAWSPVFQSQLSGKITK